jgi:hypothetical protein
MTTYEKKVIHIDDNDNSLCDAFKDVWKTQQSTTGGYLTLHHINFPSSTQYIPIIMDIIHSSGQIQIYLKA